MGLLPAVEPNRTEAPGVKPVPLMVTCVPPVVGAVVSVNEEMEGAVRPSA